MGKCISWVLAAVLGMGLAAGCCLSVDLVKVTGSDMLPSLEPGSYALVSRIGLDDLRVGDLVLYERPYFEVTGGAKRVLRRVAGMQGEQVELACDAQMAEEKREIVKREEILGKVIQYGKERTQAGGQQQEGLPRLFYRGNV